MVRSLQKSYLRIFVLSYSQTQSKRQRVGKSSIRFYHKTIAALPDAIQCFLSNLVNPCNNQVEVIGKLDENGHMLFASNKELVLWNYSPLYEFTNVINVF